MAEGAQRQCPARGPTISSPEELSVELRLQLLRYFGRSRSPEVMEPPPAPSRRAHHSLPDHGGVAAELSGLLLPALWEAAFDKGLVSFADDGTALAAIQLGHIARRVLSIDAALRIDGLRDEHRHNLALHRARYGFGARQ